MRTLRLRRDSIFCRVITGLLAFGFAANVLANPTGLTTGRGTATAHQSGSHLTVTASQNAFLNWKTFNIAAGETTTFVQPSSTSIVWNRVNDPNPSQIFGTIQANGVVVLLNSSGFYFGPNSFVSAAGLVVSTANCAPPENGGGTWEFNGPPPLASIINYGHIAVGNGGSAFLIADQIENHGTMEAPGGSIGLAAGQTIMLSERPDGRGMSLQVTLPQGSVDNVGNLIADAGTISLNAKVVNQNGLVQANSVQNNNGVIELVASDSLTLGAGSRILAQGDASATGSSGGTVTLKSGTTFSDIASSQIITAGGAQGGNGGDVEVSAPNILSLDSSMNASAQAGGLGGTLLIDPDFITLGTSGSGTVPADPANPANGTVAYNSGSGTLLLNVNTAFLNKNFSLITLQAKSDITLAANTTWNLSTSTAVNGGLVKLQAGRDIILSSGSKIFDANNWALTLQAGYNFVNNTVKTGTGNITFNGNSSIQTAAGNITLAAGNGVQLGSGTVSTTGGNVTWQAGGDVTFGSGSKITTAANGAVALQAGYNFVNNTVTAGTGKITFIGSSSLQTAAGNIGLTAGQSITVGKGYVNTTAGGSITAQALKGNINTGSYAQGYVFNSGAGSIDQAYDLTGGLGGISTKAGGDVNLTAGGNVTSFLPVNSTATAGATAGSGAYGAQAGNVTIVAGGNVTGQYLVANGIGSIYAGVQMDTTTGQPKKDAAGSYLLGTTGSAGSDTSNPNLALSLISGGWNVTAAKNIILQEVRNPNGVFNTTAGTFFHYFDYAPNAYVNLSAGNLVQLGPSGGGLPRLDVGDGVTVPMIFPPILNVQSGDGIGVGNVVLSGDDFNTQLILFPSPQGSLTIKTTAGSTVDPTLTWPNGSLVGQLGISGNAAQIFNLIVSDSGKKQYTTTGNFTTTSDFGLDDHAATPIHLNNPTPITMDIAGDMSLILIGAPEAAQITVGGNLNNCRFQGMNLSDDPNQTVQVQVRKNDGSLGTATVHPGLTTIHVTGDINDRGDITSVDLGLNPGTTAPDLSVLSEAWGNTINGKSISAATLTAAFFYDATTKKLTYKNITGFSASSVFALLQNLQIQNGYDSSGNLQTINVPVFDQPKDPNVSLGLTAQALMNQYNADNHASGLLADVGPPDNSNGILFGGGGKLDISARNVDLGTTLGIQSVGAGLYRIGSFSPLAQLFNQGADLSVTTTTGDINMFASSIASLNGGSIYINAGRNVNVGSADYIDNSIGARGIYSTSGSDVMVYANNDININGSRIGAFDGGNVTVESFNGNINAGVGGLGGVTLTAYYVNPVTHALSQNSSEAFGSGILAETSGPRNDSPNYAAPVHALGNVLVETPNGNVNANKAGVLQLAFNHVDYPSATVEVLAGYELRDSSGNPLTAGGIASGTPVLVSDNRNVDASNSGVIAQNAILKATGDVKGAIFAKGNVDVTAVNNVNVTALAQGTANVSAGGTLSGTIIGIGGITASGSSVDAALLSNAGISGATSGQTGFAQGTAANATAQADQSPDAAKAAETGTGDDPEEQNKKKKGITLAAKVSRVTVLLPTKNN